MNLVHFGPYFLMLFLCFLLFQYKTPNPKCQFSCKPPLPQNPNPPFGILCNLFHFLETDQYGSDIFGSIDNVRILFYFILFFELNSRAFQLEIKWCDPFENQEVKQC
jgi:hypothetical protein